MPPQMNQIGVEPSASMRALQSGSALRMRPKTLAPPISPYAVVRRGPHGHNLLLARPGPDSGQK
jgi:hypothetical protein